MRSLRSPADHDDATTAGLTGDHQVMAGVMTVALENVALRHLDMRAP
ncbi:hypothetical protein FHR90_002052 [Endobacter medicaginis]|uniref:Uncharacterized protein n=1 Tax=Endobacter medicaginis TaxID=1181271 RepID=A0A839UWQ3_9PROT|nr:hypothetical protein [Endobacter medicaginis]MBB3174216.1 hypothetical protein [Endobacter medicaginis]MCX5474260.1 hypothetical protein [Endobacter medicaginis]NVN31446.1 hypothetical protein [Endobacter medicaginis]